MTAATPLADRLRPRHLDEVIGHERWLGPSSPLRLALERGRVGSLLLWGPPGCGKTTLARAIAASVDHELRQLSAVLDGVKTLREVLSEAESLRASSGRGTLLFVDEIHRWNKAQQDALLPHVESGHVALIGATTENPAFELNAALRSRLQILRLEPLSDDEVKAVLRRALTHPEGVRAEVDDDVLDALARLACGDARRALTSLEACVLASRSDEPLTLERATALLQEASLRHDRSGDDHYDVVSALIKSLRGSDPDAALYWMARLIAAGEDPLFLARRLIVFASEDVGNADPRALQVAVDAARGLQIVGMPEGRILLGQAVTWLACCPKSNASYKGIDAALEEVRRTGALPVPYHLRNAPTELARREGHGVGYLYPHDHPHRVVDQAYLPERLRGRRFYEPADHAEERRIRERLAWWDARRRPLRAAPEDGDR